MPHVAWTLTDSSTGSPVVYTFPINPNAFDLPNRQATITEETSSAPNGSPIIFQGRDAVPKGSFSGVVRGAAMKSDIALWAGKWYPLVLTDDIGNVYTVIITSLRWNRLRRAIEPHRYDYSIEFMVVA